MTISINNIQALRDVAEQLTVFSGNEGFFAFEGSMGAGKTTFIKALCEVFGVADVVTSPTFSIVNEYDAQGTPVYHFDFYRLKTLQEAYDIGYEEYFYSGYPCLVEWPGKIAPLLPENYIRVSIEITGETERKFTFEKVTNGNTTD